MLTSAPPRNQPIRTRSYTQVRVSLPPGRIALRSYGRQHEKTPQNQSGATTKGSVAAYALSVARFSGVTVVLSAALSLWLPNA